MGTVAIHRANREDLKDLQSVSRTTFKESFGEQNTAEDMEKYLREKFSEEQLLLELDNPNSAFYLATLDEDVVGYLKLNTGQAQTELKDDSGLEIERIYVLNKFIGKGIGKQLFKQTLDIARQKKSHFIWLGVWEKNERALTFYHKNGFVEFDKHIFVLGDDHQTDILMKLELN
ncbi:MAG: GNAT family N-acetyltransferase [Brumimicrobium sp.]|nr:GNAT family N-acetyltransferase [Brumimicrobium sp.]